MGNDKSRPWWPSNNYSAEVSIDKQLESNQIKTEHDTYVWEISDMELLERFLVLGSGSCYKANDKVPERKDLKCLDRLIGKGKGKEVVKKLLDYSMMNRTPRQQYIIIALAVCARSNDAETKKLAYESLSKICRIPTHLFLFLHYCKQESMEGSKQNSGECGKQESGEWGKQKCGECGKQKSGECGKQESGECGKQKSGECGKQKSGECGKQESGECGKQNSGECGKQESGKQKSGECGKQESGKCGKQKSSECGKHESDECGKQNSGECGKPESGECGKQKSGECGKHESGECGTQKSGECGKQKSGKSHKKDSGERDKHKGWGKAHKRAVINWYREKSENPLSVAYLLTKYKAREFKKTNDDKKRERWSHKDVFRLAHPSDDPSDPNNDAMKVILRYVMKSFEDAQTLAQKTGCYDKMSIMLTYLEATEKAKNCSDEDDLVELIRKHKLEREHVPTQMMRSPKVCEALVVNMKPEAKLRNLCMISAKVLNNCDPKIKSEIEEEIVKTLNDHEKLNAARVHPFRILVALIAYEKETGKYRIRSKNGGQEAHKVGWKVNKNVLDALYAAFEHSFTNVQSTGKRYLLAIDVSKSMEVPCIGCHAITCDQAAAAMVMTTVRTENKCKVLTFSDKVERIKFKKDDHFKTILQKTKDTGKTLKMDNTDCALPMLWALEHKKKIDVFIVYTDNVPSTGQVHASDALRKYREEMKIPNAKLIVVAMAPNEFTIANPSDRDYRELNIVGFDAIAPQIIAKFSM